MRNACRGKCVSYRFLHYFWYSKRSRSFQDLSKSRPGTANTCPEPFKCWPKPQKSRPEPPQSCLKVAQQPPRDAQDLPEPPKTRAAQEPPRAAQELPRAAQEPPKSGPELSKSRSEPPKSDARAVLSHPRGAKMVQKTYKIRYETLLIENAFRIVFYNSFGT